MDIALREEETNYSAVGVQLCLLWTEVATLVLTLVDMMLELYVFTLRTMQDSVK